MGTVDKFEFLAGADGVAASPWRDPPTLTLDEHGVIVGCSERGEEIFGYARTELIDRHVSTVLPELSNMELLKDGQPNAHFSFLCHIGHAFEVVPRAGAAFLCGFSLVCLHHAGHTLFRLIVQS